MRIGIIGSGKIGATIGRLWAKAGHSVRFGSREPERLAAFAEEFGASVGTQDDAVGFAEAMFTASPYGSWPDMAARLAPSLVGKLVMDAANPYPARDGAFAQSALDAKQGSGAPVARLLPGAYYVRAFNSVYWETLRDQAHRAPPLLAIPLVGDDLASLDEAAGLVADAGFDPLVVGPLVHACTFDVGAPAYNHPSTREDLERLLGLVPPG
jgi:predicted dinucleotide-binding enzyme